jgi:hypothetical protein
VPQGRGFNGNIARQRKGFSRAEIHATDISLEDIGAEGEEGRTHQPIERFPQATFGHQVPGAQEKARPRIIGGFEKRQANNMVEMQMRQQQVDGFNILTQETFAERPQPCSGIQYDHRLTAADFNARCVATISAV